MKIYKLILIIFPILLILGLLVFLIVYNQPCFIGERTKNPDSYVLNIKKMHGTDSHVLSLSKEDVLKIRFKIEEGNLQMEIKAPDNTVIYKGNGKITNNFEINITQSGEYTISLKANHAKGYIDVCLK